MKLNAVARELTTDLRLAQQLTITEQVIHLVNLDTINNTYEIRRLGIATTTIKNISFPDEVNFQQINNLTNNQVSFN